MCGIAGFIHFEKERTASRETVKKMTDVIFHRGPDGEGFHVEGPLALGHRRLAIIDLNTGQQPMYSQDHKVVLIFNGEIYNYIELKDELTGLGYQFTTTSDTEVIINAYRAWGTDCQNRFNGMWAFALWDAQAGRLFLSRDRIGEKPLYYAVSDNTLVFGSEIKSLLAYGLPATPRPELTAIYLTLSFIPAPYTFYKNIHQLLPGNYLLTEGSKVKAGVYWNLPDITEKDLLKDKTHIESEFAKLFDDAVKIRMRSDVDFGAFLSGGLDSSCVVGTMAKNTSRPVQTFTVGFENKQFDESDLAMKVAEKFHTNHHQGTVTSEHFDQVLDKILYHYDEPFGDASAIPTGHISKYAAGFVKMVLTGDGGDEVLSGYTTYQGEKFARQYQQVPAPFRKLMTGGIKIAAKPFRGHIRFKLNRVAGVLESSSLPFEDRLLSKLASVSPAILKQLIKTTDNTISFHDFYRDVMKQCRFEDSFYKLMYFQHKVTLPDDMLTKVDRMSMAYSIETRIPFLDYRIIELLYRVHKNLKMKGYLNKVILRNAVANQLLPEQLLHAPKRGFNVPLRDWFREDNLNSRIKEILLSDKNNPAYNSVPVSKLIDQNSGGQSDAGDFIWMLLLLKKWMNKYEQGT